MGKYTLIITEKPNASKRIAEALADGKPIKKSEKGVPYYEITHKKKDLVIGCAVGHLYGLAEKKKTKVKKKIKKPPAKKKAKKETKPKKLKKEPTKAEKKLIDINKANSIKNYPKKWIYQQIRLSSHV